MNRWRPEGWINPYPADSAEMELIDVRGAVVAEMTHEIYEAGADAMLEGVCEEIEKVELGREEIDMALMCGGIPPGDFYDDIALAMKQKILTLLRSKGG